MAGSYNHCVDDSGRLLNPEELTGMLEARGCGDVFEAIEELYGMVWFLAQVWPDPAGAVESARLNYGAGLQDSPGVDGSNPKED